jgi:glycosyltransferase involved in cell wall biosynthesis
MSKFLAFDWGVSPTFGWGVYGLNLMLYWPMVANSATACAGQVDMNGMKTLNPLHFQALAESFLASLRLKAQREAQPNRDFHVDGIALHGLGNQLSGPPAGQRILGRRTCALAFMENTDLPDAVSNCAPYDMLIVGSTWNEKLARERGVANVATVLQGIDPAIFHPGPRAGFMEGKFVIFSGGKLEHRKGQDLVLKAFWAFAQRRPDAVLVTAWHSPWPELAKTFEYYPDAIPVSLDPQGKVSAPLWAANYGIPADRVIDLGAVPNHQLATILREVDVGLFPSRCEGGTNLVAMECMACGVPTIVSGNTGHLDLVDTGAPLMLVSQTPVEARYCGTQDWGESDVDEMVEMLDHLYNDRSEAEYRGNLAAKAMSSWDWRHQIGTLSDVLGRI